MILDKQLLNEIIRIDEITAGWIDHPDFKRVLSDLMAMTKQRLKNNSNILIKDLTIWDKQFTYSLKFFKYRKLPTDPKILIEKKLKVIFVNKEPPEDKKDYALLDVGSYTIGNRIEIIFEINNTKLVKDLLDSTNKIEEYIAHELVHVFKYLYGSYQKTKLDYMKKDNTGGFSFIDDWYWTNKHEIQAYLTSINVQLKNIKQLNPNVKFSEAIGQTDGWNQFRKFLPPNRKDILNYILKKSVHYWQYNLGGKINESRIKLD
jgi:hypothetical protein